MADMSERLEEITALLAKYPEMLGFRCAALDLGSIATALRAGEGLRECEHDWQAWGSPAGCRLPWDSKGRRCRRCDRYETEDGTVVTKTEASQEPAPAREPAAPGELERVAKRVEAAFRDGHERGWRIAIGACTRSTQDVEADLAWSSSESRDSLGPAASGGEAEADEDDVCSAVLVSASGPDEFCRLQADHECDHDFGHSGAPASAAELRSSFVAKKQDTQRPPAATERKPHRQICSLCHEVCRVDFWVPNETWILGVHESQIHERVCLTCFTRLADERGVDWSKEIKFFPAPGPLSRETEWRERSDRFADRCVALSAENDRLDTQVKELLQETRRLRSRAPSPPERGAEPAGSGEDVVLTTAARLAKFGARMARGEFHPSPYREDCPKRDPLPAVLKEIGETADRLRGEVSLVREASELLRTLASERAALEEELANERERADLNFASYERVRGLNSEAESRATAAEAANEELRANIVEAIREARSRGEKLTAAEARIAELEREHRGVLGLLDECMDEVDDDTQGVETIYVPIGWWHQLEAAQRRASERGDKEKG